MEYDAEVLIQDVNRENAEIYKTGHMYVADAERMESPLYFAPYFTQENEKPGLYDVSQVLWVELARIHESDVVQRFDHWFKTDAQMSQLEEDWEKHWRNGLQMIIELAKKHDWQDDENRLYFLGQPLTIRVRPLLKSEKFHQIPKNYSLDFAEVLAAYQLGSS